ncbi:hypothetical protein ASPACDRAFT_1895167 [Aspergillus aculeatus ATCC 16872]|uniref:Zn(2)-C6 fungal-type domain-containing protein n=1 Tax=Aspergillus aculeatus (strain ATCC 16872 / CBS 172.66 / WB 5094) TaxID=690307 RepID=A0A1L9X6C7_ASPA1|nr:uncharacterized protein ASPACDRAFT_1895167 [Aspergillus aculeatus ATCC 16872]OJK04026.1 hypothetical protein ASPACDRAFT_1895167 [Aspergillus aculeatus ATCC 16872]
MPNPRLSKRKRIGRACDQCRRRKSKCGGEQPVCSICQAANRTCTYQNSSRRRGLQSGYVRSLEVALGIILDRVPNSESTLQRIVQGAREGKRFACSELADRWRRSKLAKEVIHLSQAEAADDAGDIDLDDGLGEDLIENCLGEGEEGEQMEMEREVPRDSGREEQQQQREDTPPQQIPVSLDLPLPDNTPELVDSYFLHTHCWFPIVERRDILRVMHTHSGSPRDSACRLVLWAIIAYTSTMSRSLRSKIQQSIQTRLIGNYETTELSHIQALLILVLLHLDRGDLGQAWVLVGHTTRLLAILPEPARTHRYKHAFVGCTFLDGIISALVHKSPALLGPEHQVCAQVDEDDVDEWDTWTMTRRVQGSETQLNLKSPLRALSTFNMIHKFMRILNRLPLCTSGVISAHEVFVDLQRLQKQISEQRPYKSREYATPPLLTLHLTSYFALLHLVEQCKLVDASAASETARNVRTMVNLLDDYVEITDNASSTPLLRCFTLQARKSLETSSRCFGGEEAKLLTDRVSRHVDMLKLEDAAGARQASEVPLFRHRVTGSLSGPPLDTPAWQVPGSEVERSDMVVAPVIPQIPTSAWNLSGALATQPVQTQETEDFDALFEEIMTSIPASRHEPTFAENLGFYAGNMDTDFLEQLQYIPEDT